MCRCTNGASRLPLEGIAGIEGTFATVWPLQESTATPVSGWWCCVGQLLRWILACNPRLHSQRRQRADSC